MLGEMRTTSSPMLVIALAALFVVGALATLYAYRSQTPAVPTVSMSEALQSINAGRVRHLTIEGTRARLDLTDGQRQDTVTSGQGEPLVSAVNAHNAANPTSAIQVRYQDEFSVVPVSALFALLPLIVVIALILLAARALSGARAGDRYEQLARIADLRDRGVLSEEEFQTEKRKVMR